MRVYRNDVCLLQPPSVPAGAWKHVWVKWGPMRQKVMKPVDVRLIFYNSTNICGQTGQMQRA